MMLRNKPHGFHPGLLILIILLAAFALQYCSEPGRGDYNTQGRVDEEPDDDNLIPPGGSDDDATDDDDSDDDNEDDDNNDDNNDDTTDDDSTDDDSTDDDSADDDSTDDDSTDDDDDDDNDNDDDNDDMTPALPSTHRTYWDMCYICHPGVHNGWYTPPADCISCHTTGTECNQPFGPPPPVLPLHEPGYNCTWCHETIHNGIFQQADLCKVCHQFEEECP